MERRREREILKGSPDYPESLYLMKKPPKRIFVYGNLDILRLPSVAIVGTRKATNYGRQVAESLGRLLGRNSINVVSGLAKGIDRFSHVSCLEEGGFTTAVLGNGIGISYPRENGILQEKIGEEGLIISEYPFDEKPKTYYFPRRNEIIAALSRVVVVVEAPIKSGAIITAEQGIEMGKEIYVVPGNITSKMSRGCNKLICDGAKALFTLEDLLIDMGIDPAPRLTIDDNLSERECAILSLVEKSGEITIEEIFHKTAINIGTISGIISNLEIKGLIHVELGKIFIA